MSEDQDREAVLERVEGYLDEVERSLHLPAGKAREVVDEMRADLLGLVGRYREEGNTESEAVHLALAEMGEAGAVSREIEEVVPPLSSGWMKWVRYALAVLMTLWTLRMAWGIRAWTYGGEGMIVPLILAVFVPMILVLWPGIIWRKNWLFGVIPGFLCVIVFLVLNAGGTSRSMKIPSKDWSKVERKARIEEAARESAADDAKRMRIVKWAVAGFGGVTVLLFLAMQQDRQRRVAIGAILVVGLGIEGAYQMEEMRFRSDVREIGEAVKAAGAVLEKGELVKAGVKAKENVSYQVNRDGKGYQVFWNRPLGDGFALVFDSKTGEVRVND